MLIVGAVGADVDTGMDTMYLVLLLSVLLLLPELVLVLVLALV